MGEEMMQKAMNEIAADADALDTLQRFYNAYTAECEVLRKLEGNADCIGDKWTEKAHHYLIDWLIYKSSEELSDYYASDECDADDDFSISELDRMICEELLYDASAPYDMDRANKI